jgi:predicted metal-dependent enzyme (double-stranded beta helix superfamily)
MVEREAFIEHCREALNDSDAQGAVHALVARAVSDPAGVVRAFGEPTLSGVQTVYSADDLTILNIAWGPGVDLHPHDHRMWAVIGIYGGQEENRFYRRSETGLTQHGSKDLYCKDTIALGDSVIHAVRNPRAQITGAIHVYGGDFFATPRSEWDPTTFAEHPYDVEHTMEVLAAANARIDELREQGKVCFSHD